MKIIVTILAFFLTQTLFGQINDIDAFFNDEYDKAFIKSHKIKEVTVKMFIDGNKPSFNIFHFDNQGLLTIQTILDTNGKKVIEYLSTYNSRGDQIERKNIDYELNKTYTTTFSKIYDTFNLVSESSSELPYTTIHKYNSKKQKLMSSIFMRTDSSQAQMLVLHYKYDSTGQLIIVNKILDIGNTPNPAIIGSTEYFYDAYKKVIKIIKDQRYKSKLDYNNLGLLEKKSLQMPEELGSVEIFDTYSYSFWEK